MSAWPHDWDRIRAHYEANRAELEQHRNRWALDPYYWDFVLRIQLTPIEQALWSDIRSEGAVLYPQFPVGRFFVDFGNPAARVAIECDGKEFHQDWRKDEQRQRAIEAAGWRVYRLTGADCMRDSEILEDEDTGAVTVRLSKAQQLIRHVCQEHGISVKGRR